MKTTAEISTIDISVDKLHISEHNTRQPKETDSGIKELSLSLATMGQTAAILVRPHPTKKGHYEIAAGARRSVAARLAGLKTLRASVREMSEDEFQTAILVDNLQRENPDPKSEAELLFKLHERGQTAVEIAAYMGKAESWVSRRMKLLSVSPKVLKAWRDPKSDIAHFTIDMMELMGSLRESEQIDLANGSEWQLSRLRDRATLLDCIRRQSPLLSSAPFDLNDPAYFVKDCGPGCATDSSKQEGIFDFQNGKKKDSCARCLDGVCFKKRLNLYLDAEYDRLCETAGKSLPVVTCVPVTIKGSDYREDWQFREYAKTGKAVVYVDKDSKLSIRYVKEKAKVEGDKAKGEATPEDKAERRINALQGKRWLLVREKLVEALEKSKHTALTCDIDIVIATFGLPYKITGSVMEPNDKRRWAQVLAGVDNSIKAIGDGYSYEGVNDFGKTKAAPRKEALWPHVKSVLIGLIPEPKRLMDAHLFADNYRCMGKLIGFDIDAAKKSADLEILPPKAFGNVDPHTLNPCK